MSGDLLIYGSSGHARVIAETALAAGWRVVGWADDDPSHLGREVDGLPVRATGTEEAARKAVREGWQVVVGIGDNRARRRVFDELLGYGARIATIVGPQALLSPSATLGRGTVVFAAAVVQAGARIGENVILNTACSVDHDCAIGNHAHLSPGVHLGGTVEVGEGAHLGVGASVRNNLTIGAWTLIGVGAAVVESIEAGVVAYGVPARPLSRPAE
ncbi:MAG TPA: acetyltransferase [Thermoanaerobaculia bacterium]|nr:acetyltransferase [Thermoanaerobaculia bacterium]